MNWNTTPDGGIDLSALSLRLNELRATEERSKPFTVSVTRPPATPEEDRQTESAEPILPEQPPTPSETPPPPMIDLSKQAQELTEICRRMESAVGELTRMGETLPSEITGIIRERMVREALNFDTTLAKILQERIREATEEVEVLQVAMKQARYDLEKAKDRRILHTILTVANVLALIWAVAAMLIILMLMR